jgi:hypothetical protein
VKKKDDEWDGKIKDMGKGIEERDVKEIKGQK